MLLQFYSGARFTVAWFFIICPLNSELLTIPAFVLQGWCWPTRPNGETKNQRHNTASENEELLAGKNFFAANTCMMIATDVQQVFTCLDELIFSVA